MTKVCGICWNEVVPDGCGYYCSNDNDLINLNPKGITEFSWLDSYLVFDTQKVAYID